MPSSPASSFSSLIVISDTDSDDAAAAALSRPVADRVASSLRTQDAVDALCQKHGVPAAYTARTAGDRRASTPPPERAVCLYAHALEAGARVPLHGFFSEALTHFGLAPGQLAPSGWRVLVGFVVLCHDAGVQPSTAVFRHFFSLSAFKLKGWYCFRAKEAAGTLFVGLSKPDDAWKGRFFFLTSPEPWPCPVRWGEPPLPSKNSVADPVLTGQENKSVGNLLRVHATAVDLRTYLCDAKLAAAFASPPPCSSLPSPGVEGMDSSAANVKPEPGGHTPSLSRTKRTKHEEGPSAKDGVCRSEQRTPHAVSGCSASALGLGAPPVRLRHSPVPDTHDCDSADWKAAKKVLECMTTPSRDRSFAAAKPSDVVASSYSTMLQAVNYASFSLDYTLELKEKLTARDKEVAALREQLEESKTEQAAAKRAAEAELERAKAAAVQQFLKSDDHTRRMAEHALAGYERGAEDMKRAALRLNPRLDAARLVLPLD